MSSTIPQKQRGNYWLLTSFLADEDGAAKAVLMNSITERECEVDVGNLDMACRYAVESGIRFLDEDDIGLMIGKSGLAKLLEDTGATNA